MKLNLFDIWCFLQYISFKAITYEVNARSDVLSLENVTEDTVGKYLCMAYSKGGRIGKAVSLMEKKRESLDDHFKCSLLH